MCGPRSTPEPPSAPTTSATSSRERQSWHESGAVQQIQRPNGAIDQSNFNNYQIARMNRAPRHIDIHIVKSKRRRPESASRACRRLRPLYITQSSHDWQRVRELPLSKTKLCRGRLRVERPFMKALYKLQYLCSVLGLRPPPRRSQWLQRRI